MNDRDIHRMEPGMKLLVKNTLDLDKGEGKNGINFPLEMSKYLGKEIIVEGIHRDKYIRSNDYTWEMDWIECIVTDNEPQTDRINIHSIYYRD